MKHPPFDLGLWAVCTAPWLALFGGALTLDLWHHGWQPAIGRWFVGATAGSLFLGYGVYDSLHKRGYRVSRPRPEQGEDYGDPG
ncbi:MAG TPA: hypothetical protein VM597_27005 [Gemmataceae bacterium]|nr:hypothetical protein [Gemmataceae bacterium]